MAITIIATPGGVDSNSYATLAEADTYLEAHLKADAWAALDDERKKAALVAATRSLENYKFGGLKAAGTQALGWPRTGVSDNDGYTISGVPSRLKSAQFEYAIWELTEEDRLAGGFELDNLDSVEIGPIKYAIGEKASSLPSHISDMLKAIGPGAVVVDSDGTVPRFRW